MSRDLQRQNLPLSSSHSLLASSLAGPNLAHMSFVYMIVSIDAKIDSAAMHTTLTVRLAPRSLKLKPGNEGFSGVGFRGFWVLNLVI